MNPNIVVAVVVEQGGYGAQSAVPIGKKIIEAAFDIPDPEDTAKEEAEKKKEKETADAQAQAQTQSAQQ